MSSEYFCKICNITCTGKAPYEQHINSTKHMKKAKLSETQTSLERPISTNICPSPPTINTHRPLTTTNNNLPEDYFSSSTFILPISRQTMRILLEWNHPLGYKPFCEICQLPLHGETNADIHFRSDNNIHYQKLAKWKQIHENYIKYSCKICAEIFSNENSMHQHFDSIDHVNQVQQKRSLEKFIQVYETYNKLKQVRKQARSIFQNSLRKVNDLIPLYI